MPLKINFLQELLFVKKIGKNLPVVVFESGPPVRRPQQRLQGARQVHEPVAHQEEHTKQNRDYYS